MVFRRGWPYHIVLQVKEMMSDNCGYFCMFIYTCVCVYMSVGTNMNM